MSDKESFERWWAGVEGPEYTPEVQKEINDRHGGEFRYGWLDPIQRATLLIERGAEAAGVPDLRARPQPVSLFGLRHLRRADSVWRQRHRHQCGSRARCADPAHELRCLISTRWTSRRGMAW